MGFEHLVPVFDTIFRQMNILVYYFSIKTAFLMTVEVLRGVQSFSIIFNHFQSFSIIFNHFSIIFNHFQSLIEID
jgi:hypothetical protein